MDEKADLERAHDAPANDRLRKARRWRGWSLRELETASGIGHGQIGLMERGEAGISWSAANKLAEALGIHVAYLWDVWAPDLPRLAVPTPPKAPRKKSAQDGTRSKKGVKDFG